MVPSDEDAVDREADVAAFADDEEDGDDDVPLCPYPPDDEFDEHAARPITASAVTANDRRIFLRTMVPHFDTSISAIYREHDAQGGGVQ